MANDVLSLSYEVSELLAATEAARALLHGDAAPVHRKEEMAAAVLSLLIERLRLLRRALDGGVDPALLIADMNRIRSPEIREARLPPWSPTEVRQHALAELDRVAPCLGKHVEKKR